MSVLDALVIALLGALGTVWVVWLRREAERDAALLTERVVTLSEEVAALSTRVDSLRVELTAMRNVAEASRAELTDFVQGPPSMRRPIFPESS